MNYNIWLDFCAIFVLAAILFSMYSKRYVPLLQNKIFMAMIWLCLVSTTADMLTGIWNNHVPEISLILPLWIYDLLSITYFLSRNLTPICYLLYVLATLGIELRTLRQKLLTFAPAVISVFLIVMTPITDAVYYVDVNGIYNRGSFLIVLYIIAFYYMAISAFFVIYYRGLIPVFQRLSLFAFVIIAMITVLIQARFPTLLAEGFGSTFCFLLIYITIQKPEELLDGTTGFLNKKMFSLVLSVKIKQKIPFSILLIGINDFNLLEKTYGLEVTDKLMTQLASYIHHYQKSSFRIAEDKIAIITNSAKQPLIQKQISDFTIRFSKSWDIAEYHIILSEFYGFFTYPEDADTPENMLELINAVNSKRKSTEKGTIININNLNIDKERRKSKVDSIVKNALEKHSLRVVYQPIYSIKEKRFVSAEALLRLNDEELGNIPPDEFIPIAEKNGAIVKIDQFVLDRVCRFTAAKQLKTLGIEYIEINLSAVDCLQENIEDSIIARLNLYNLDMNQINLELTETAMNTLPESVYQKIHFLSEKGIPFSLDDYGTGYSNLNRMTTLPFDIIKIDKSIAQNAFVSESIKVILDSTVQMVKRLNKKVLVEGVETKEQADYMADIGCDYIQGYYYSRPISEEDFLQLLKCK